MPRLADFERTVTARARSFFADDIAAREASLTAAIRGRRILVVGGGGSIGAATTRALLAYAPAGVVVVDISENYLAELVRDIRSRNAAGDHVQLETHVFDYGAPVMQRFLAAMPKFDAVLNFAAIKHVRAERDVYSVLHMLDVNVVRQARFKRWLAATGPQARYFAVSTDKAANPVSMMGASKRLMEDVAFDVARDAFQAATSTRFANVAFSNGSLLQAFLIRIEKRQPLAVPIATRRFFVSHAEAADICLLSAFTAPDAHVLVPTLDPASHLTLLQDVAERVLRTQGYAPRFVDDEPEARAAMAEVDATGCWPVLLTPLDTAGEKPFEEFVGEGEQMVDVGMRSLRGIAHRRNPSLDALLETLVELVDEPQRHVDKARLVELLGAAVPAMRHRETGASLDARM